MHSSMTGPQQPFPSDQSLASVRGTPFKSTSLQLVSRIKTMYVSPIVTSSFFTSLSLWLTLLHNKMLSTSWSFSKLLSSIYLLSSTYSITSPKPLSSVSSSPKLSHRHIHCRHPHHYHPRSSHHHCHYLHGYHHHYRHHKLHHCTCSPVHHYPRLASHGLYQY